MANTKITELTQYTNPVSTDVLPVVDVGADVTKKASIADLLKNASAGTAAAPGIAFDGDGNTGILSPSADQLAIATGGIQRLLVDGSGNVSSTGTSTATAFIPTGSSIPTNGLYLPSANNVAISTNGANRLHIASDGKVGVGTTSAQQKLHLEDSGSNVYLRVTETGNTGIDFGQATNGNGIINLRDNAAIQIFTNASERLRITSAGLVGIGTSAPQSLFHIAGGGTGRRGALRFSDSGGANYWEIGRDNGVNGSFTFAKNGTEYLCIDYLAGNVGIGTTSPGATLHVVGGSSNPGVDTVAIFSGGTNATSGSGARIYLSGSSTPTARGAYVEGVTESNTNNHALVFATNAALASPLERARIDSSGRLLVGTSTPLSTNIAGLSYTGSQEQLAGTDGNTTTKLIAHYSTSSSFSPNLAFARSSDATLGSHTAVTSGHPIGRITAAGSDGTKFTEGGRIDFTADAAFTTDSAPTRLVFSTTADGASSPTERMQIRQNGRVMIASAGDFGAGTDGEKFIVIGDAGYACSFRRNTNTGGIILFKYGGSEVGSISTDGTNTAYNTSSDYRLKENVVPLTGAADRLNQLQVHRFNFIADPDTVVDGFLAHEAQAVVPECVTGAKDEVDDDGNPVYQGIDQSKLVPLLTAALQEALAKIEVLEQRLSDVGIA